MSATRPARLRRPGILLVGESLLLAVVLTVTSGLTAGSSLGTSADPSSEPEATASADPTSITEPTAAADPTSTADAGGTPEPEPTVEPTPTVEPSPVIEPSPAPEPSIDPEPDASALPDPSADASAEPEPAATPAPLGLHVDHVWVDAIDRRTGVLRPGALDAPAVGVERGRIYVVRFRVVNDSDGLAELRLTAEFGFGGAPASWTTVPVVDPVRGVALYSSANVLRGEAAGSEPLPISELRLAASDDPDGQPARGLANAGVNPAPRLTLEPGAFTEISFTVRATASAAWLSTYSVRLADGGQPLGGPSYAALQVGGRPPADLSPGQRSGIEVEDASPTSLASSTTSSSLTSLTWSLTASAFTTPHGDYTLTTDKCAACHSTHIATGPLLAVQPPPQSTLCLTCHDGTGAEADVKAEYTDPAVPANDPDTGSWYSHPATTLSNHTTDRDPAEFDGVLNRHAACADCHQPHRSDASPAIQTAAGWTASGALLGASGVTVTYGAAGTEPTYEWLAASTFEYQLCFKCHSGFTELPPQSGPPSIWALDKAVELNPANLSYHPVLAPGTNTTTRMANSLSGTSPYKLWTFAVDSTVRCVNCHGDSRTADPASPPDPGSALAPHAVPNRGMLIANLRDRALKGPSDAYQAGNFALCYACHAEAPFVDTSQGPRLDTNFPQHGLHSAAIASFSGAAGGTVDDDGAGRGNALCAECHFRTHGTTYAVDGQDPEPRLLNFAPNVQPYGGADAALAGILDYDADASTCTLTCHGVDHAGWGY